MKKIPLFFLALLVVSLTSAWSVELSGGSIPQAVPTFECVGLYWKPPGAAADNPCAVNYRISGEKEWKGALPLWFDPTDHPALSERSQEYRGSIVNLKPGTTYEIRLKLEKTSVEKLLTVKTWDEKFPILKTVYLDQGIKETITISEGGSKEGYVLYTTPLGAQPGFDVGGKSDVNIQVNASFVILKGLVLRGAKIHGIQLGDVQDVVIDECDISGWGRINSKTGFGENLDSALYSRSSQLERIIVQNCKLHSPRSNSSSWVESREDGKPNAAMFSGPQAITFMRSKGHFVIRRNQIYSDMTHRFKDGMGELKNSSFAGFPMCDSDIYGNVLSNVSDDAIEVEGANMNVRVWGNTFNEVAGAIGCATTSLGPIYLWRNVFGKRGSNSEGELNPGGYFVKLGSENDTFNKGKMFLFHNTMLQPPPRTGSTGNGGGGTGFFVTGATKRQSHMTSRNNILFVYGPNQHSIKDPVQDPTNDFDYDLYNGLVVVGAGNESHGLFGTPEYDLTRKDRYPLKSGSLGVDAGCRIPNFNDEFTGKAPDLGAFEILLEDLKK